MFRRALENYSRNKIFKRRLPPQFDSLPLFVSPQSSLSLWRFDIERADRILFRTTLELVSRGDIVWDVGANVGLFSFAAASLAGPSGRVLAVEPNHFLSYLLRRSAEINRNVVYVDVLCVALLDSLGIQDLQLVKRGQASNYLAVVKGGTQAGGIQATQKVITVTLDWLLDYFPAPNVLKIDAEGAEEKILRGGRKLLQTIRPIIFCEVSQQIDAVTSIFKENGYSLYDAKVDLKLRKPLDKVAYNTIAYPRGQNTQ